MTPCLVNDVNWFAPVAGMRPIPVSSWYLGIASCPQSPIAQTPQENRHVRPERFCFLRYGRRMNADMPPDIAALDDAYAAIERDARALAEGLTEERAAWRAHPGSWSVAECVDHLATSTRIYLAAMQPAAARALASG